MNPDDGAITPMDRALRELELELGLPVDASSKAPPPRGRIRWKAVYEWCRKHPGVKWTAPGIHANAVYKFRERYRDDTKLVVEGTHYRKEPGGRRIADMTVVYDPDA